MDDYCYYFTDNTCTFSEQLPIFTAKLELESEFFQTKPYGSVISWSSVLSFPDALFWTSDKIERDFKVPILQACKFHLVKFSHFYDFEEDKEI